MSPTLSAPRFLMVLTCVGALTGCITVTKQQYASLTAGAIGCPVEELTISGEKNEFSMGDQVPPWVAECRGHRFICSSVGSNASCKEELQAVTPPAPAATPAPTQATDSAR